MKPEIKKFLNVYQYLQDIYQFRKNQSAQFSYDSWAKELGISDKSYIRFMVLGKRHINEKMIESLSNNLELANNDKEYFKVLTHYTQSKTQEHKELFGKKLITLLREGDSDQLEIEAHYEFLSNPLLPRLQIFLGFQDLDQSPKNLAWLLGTSVEELQIGLQKLADFKMIEKSETGYKALKKSFKVPDGFGDLGLEAFYINNLKAAEAAIQLPKEERRYKSLFLPLNPPEFEKYLENLQNFVNEQIFTFNPDEYSDRRLYQVHYNIIPVSEGVSSSNAFF